MRVLENNVLRINKYLYYPGMSDNAKSVCKKYECFSCPYYSKDGSVDGDGNIICSGDYCYIECYARDRKWK